MDKPNPAEAPAPAPPRRRNWPIAVAILALATALFSLATLRGGQTDQAAPSATTNVDLAALAKQGPLAVPLYQGLAQEQAAPAAASTKSVEAMGYKFTPATLSIAVGDTVTWTNHDSAPHNVVISDGPVKFTSPTLNTGDTYTYTFTVAGKYDYYCSIHPDMQASITVEGDSTTPPPTTGTSTPPSGDCVSSQALSAFMAHVKSAHLERGLFQQVTDILDVNQYVLTHTVWLEQVLKPVFDGTADQVVKDTLAPVIAHIQSAHLERSPLQQVTDILAVDQYVLTHTVWLETVLKPAAEQLTC